MTRFMSSSFSRFALLMMFIPILLLGCVKEVEQEPLEELHEVVFHAGWAPDTRTVLQEDGSVWWSYGDQISLFTGAGADGGYRLSATIDAPAPVTDFVGEIGSETGAVYSAIYPYNSSNYFDGTHFGIFFYGDQVAQEGTFSIDAFKSIAQSTNNHLLFKNVCGGIKLTVENEGITQITIEALGNINLLGGYMEYVLDENGIPHYSSGGSSSVLRVYAPDSRGFEPKKDYYVVLPSVSIPNGIKISFYREEDFASWTYRKPVEIHRSAFKRLDGIDKDLKFHRNFNDNAVTLHEFLPNDIEKEAITEIRFHAKDNTVTDKELSASAPVYYDIDGTIVNIYTASELFDISEVTHIMFSQYSALQNLDLSSTIVNRATSFYGMFRGCLSLESIQFGDWDTIHVTDMTCMFAGCRQLRSLDLSFMDTQNVIGEGMFGMFNECWQLSSLDLSSFDTSNVTGMTSMFNLCKRLTHINLSSFNTSNVKRMDCMFQGCELLSEIDLTGFDTRQVTNMSSMFSWCESLKNLDLSSFNTSSVINFDDMFYACMGLESLDLSNFQTSKCQSMHFMFGWCLSLKELRIANFSSESLQTAELMFASCSRLQKLDLGAFDVSSANCQDIGQAMMRTSKAGAIRCTPETKTALEQTMDEGLSGRVTWLTISDDISTYEYHRNPDLYYSSDFSKHETVRKLYSATKGKGINIVIMGDAYSDRMIANGQYDADMELAIDAIFEKEPAASFKDYFNIYIVYLVSDNEVLEESTALYGVSSGSGILNGYVSANLLSSYVNLATGNSDLSYSTEIVVVRGSEGVTGYATFQAVGADGEANETHFYDCDYGHGYGAICVSRGDPSLTELFKITVQHEFGHAFAMLADEYSIYAGSIEDTYQITEMYNRFGWAQNVDITSDPSTIRWSCFLSDDRYAEDGVGIYEGGATYSTGVWRPSENSIMNIGTEFNAPSRAAIYRKIYKLAYGRDWQFDYETFVQWDLKNIGLEKRAAKAGTNAYHPHFQHKPFVKIDKKKRDDGLVEVNVIMN